VSRYLILVHYGEDEPPVEVPVPDDPDEAEAHRQALVKEVDHALEMDAPVIYSDATGDDPRAGVPIDPRRVTTIELVDAAEASER
jgi:hypothetical protein